MMMINRLVHPNISINIILFNTAAVSTSNKDVHSIVRPKEKLKKLKSINE